MSKHGVKTAFALAGIVSLVVVHVMLIPRTPLSPSVSNEQFDGIKKGMSKDQVENLLGRPPDFGMMHQYAGPLSVDHCETWDAGGNGRILIVLFDKNSYVVDKQWGKLRCAELPIHERIRQWIPF